MVEVFSNQISADQITVRGLSVAYQDWYVLENISLQVQPGEFVSLVGPSGSGKTTLLNALAGFIRYTGEIKIPGKVGVVFQDYSVFPWMTVAQNIAFGLHDSNHDRRTDVVQQHLQLIQLEDKGDKYPAELSGGQVQRVGIARALAPKPEVILMDEPYGALDRHTREKMQGWLLDIWMVNHRTIIFVTHDIEEAIFLSDRVLLLNHRNIAEEYKITFDRPRGEEIKFSSEFIRLKKNIYDRMQP